ncbi:hypothetical protein LSAT2_003777 [Lamellibrachia satsuma]|nr:hypothetical protein LSAT2_003777 [Lamellibrachia satsuma]
MLEKTRSDSPIEGGPRGRHNPQRRCVVATQVLRTKRRKICLFWVTSMSTQRSTSLPPGPRRTVVSASSRKRTVHISQSTTSHETNSRKKDTVATQTNGELGKKHVIRTIAIIILLAVATASLLVAQTVTTVVKIVALAPLLTLSTFTIAVVRKSWQFFKFEFLCSLQWLQIILQYIFVVTIIVVPKTLIFARIVIPMAACITKPALIIGVYLLKILMRRLIWLCKVTLPVVARFAKWSATTTTRFLQVTLQSKTSIQQILR